MENKKFYIFKIVLFIILFLIQFYLFGLIIEFWIGRYIGGTGLILILTSYFLVKYVCDMSVVKRFFNIN